MTAENTTSNLSQGIKIPPFVLPLLPNLAHKMEAGDLSFEVKTSTDLNEMLTGALMDARRGIIDADVVKSITLIADEINKNNVNAIEYKRLSKHKKELSFFEGENNELSEIAE